MLILQIIFNLVLTDMVTMKYIYYHECDACQVLNLFSLTWIEILWSKLIHVLMWFIALCLALI